MDTRDKIITSFYNQINEDIRLTKTRHGQLEYATTMHYIHKYANPNSKILEVGAGTGRYSIALACEGMDVTAVELVESNLEVLKNNSKDIKSIQSYQGDATNLSRFKDNTFDVTLVLGPLYHLYENEEVNKAIDEAIRVTKQGGIIMFAFISIYAIMTSNYLFGNWKDGLDENYTSDYKVRHFKEQLFTGYDIVEFEKLFENKNVEWITTAGTDGILESLEPRNDFKITDSDFISFIKWHLNFSEKRELIGQNNHLLYICRKK